MQIKKFMVVMGITTFTMLSTASVISANEIDKLTDNKQAVQSSGTDSSKGSSSGGNTTSKSSSSSSSKSSSSGSEVERAKPKNTLNGDMYANEGTDSSEIEDSVDKFRKELPEARDNEVLSQVQSVVNQGKKDAGNTARSITKPVGKWAMMVVNVIVDLLGVLFLVSTAVSLLYAMAPFLRFLFDDDDVAQRTNQMAQASQGAGGAAPGGFKTGLRSILKVDDDMLQAMIEGDLMQGASQGAAMASGGYGGQGMAFGGGYGGGQITRQALHNAPRASKHVLWTYMKKRAVTLILLFLFISIFFTSVAFDMAGDITGLVVRLIDYVRIQIQSI